MKKYLERLYKHHIYHNYLYNVCNDLAIELEERGFNLIPQKYDGGKYYNWNIDNDDGTFEEVLESIIQNYDPEYYSDLEYFIKDDLIQFYIWI